MQQENEPPARRRAPWHWLGRIALVAVGLGLGWSGARRVAAVDATTPVGNWETAVVERRDITATVLATGVVRPRVGAQVSVGSRASGVVRKLHVTVGERVRAGQLLAELDRTEFETQVERAAALEANAEGERTFAENELARMQQLFEREAATRMQLAEAERAVLSARAREREMEAALQSARVQLGYASIHAPIAGIVGSVSTQEGETVAASFAAPEFLTIVDLSRLEVWAYVDETDIGRIALGQRAQFTVDTWPDEAFDGRVIAIRPTAETRNNVVNYVTLIEIENQSERLLRPEMTATINIELEGRQAVLSVPNGAIRRDSNGSFVLVPTANGLERRTVQIGFRGAEYSELVSGIEDGLRVVVGSSTQPCEAVTPREDT